MRAIIPIIAICLMGLVFQPACTTADEADEIQFTLTVILGEGVSGDPVAGTFTYDQGDVVNYSFTLGAGYGSLTVTLDGTDVPASGTVTMNTDHVLSARSGGCAVDIRGKWKGIMVWPFYNPFNIYDLYFDIECFGDLLSGRLEGNLDLFPMKERGTYSVEGCEIRLDIEIQLIVTRADNSQTRASRSLGIPATGQLVMRGTAENPNRIIGTWEMRNVHFNNLLTYSVNIIRIDRHDYSGTFWLEKE
jgi:hypothetical protein